AKREQSGAQQGDAFNVSPPGQPMEFGPGIFMAPFGMPQEEGEDGAMSPEGNENSQGRSGGRNSQQQGKQQKGQQPGQFDDLAQRLGALKEALQSLFDRFSLDGA